MSPRLPTVDPALLIAAADGALSVVIGHDAYGGGAARVPAGVKIGVVAGRSGNALDVTDLAGVRWFIPRSAITSVEGSVDERGVVLERTDPGP
jgi:hypothetical protein